MFQWPLSGAQASQASMSCCAESVDGYCFGSTTCCLLALFFPTALLTMLLSTQRSTSTTRPTSTCSVRLSHSRRVRRQRNVSQQGHLQPVDAVSAASAGAGAAAVATDSAVVQPISSRPSPLEPTTGYVPAEADLAKVTHHRLLTPPPPPS